MVRTQEPPQGIVATLKAAEEGDYIFWKEMFDTLYKITKVDLLFDEDGEVDGGEVIGERVDGSEVEFDDVLDLEYELNNPHLGALLLPKSVMAHVDTIAAENSIPDHLEMAEHTHPGYTIEAAKRIHRSG